MHKDKAILPISYFGPIEYYSILKNYDSTIEVNENYQKRTVRNRTKILSSNGPINLSVPLKKGKTQLPIREVKISYDTPWAAQHIKSIRSAYNSSPYYEHYADKINAIIEANYTTLYELNMSILAYFTKVGIAAESYQQSEAFLVDRSAFHIDMTATSTEWNSHIQPYQQVFEDKYGFTNNLSILDALFNLGPETRILFNHE